MGRNVELLLHSMESGVSFWGDENFLELIVMVLMIISTIYETNPTELYMLKE